MDAAPEPRARLAARSDAPAIAAILRQAFAEYRPLYTPQAFAATTPTAAQIAARWDEGPVWVVAVAGQVAGTVAAVPIGSGLYVRSMAVLPEARGRGLGGLLLRQAEQHAVEQGLSRLLLSTTPFLHQAIRLYERYGFQRTELGPHDLHGTPLFTLEKTLGRHA